MQRISDRQVVLMATLSSCVILASIVCCQTASKSSSLAKRNVPAKVQRTGIAAAMIADLNCDGSVNFNDINPFVLYLSDNAAWQATYPGCPTVNGDCNGDGYWGQGHYEEVNSFIAALNGHPQAVLISGRVTDSVTGEGIPGVTINIGRDVNFGPNP